MVRHAPPSSDRTARSRPPPASSSPISRSRSEGPPFSDLATTAAAWCTSSTGLGPSTTTSWNWVTGLSWRTCPRSRSRARPGTGSPWRRCLDPDRSRPPGVLETRSTISSISFVAERSALGQDGQSSVRSIPKKSDRPSRIQPAATTATRGHRGWRCGEEKVVDHRVDNDRHDDIEDDQPPTHPVGHLSPPTSCRRLRFHGQDYYRDSINRFLDDGRKDPRRLSCPELVRQRHRPPSRWPFRAIVLSSYASMQSVSSRHLLPLARRELLRGSPDRGPSARIPPQSP